MSRAGSVTERGRSQREVETKRDWGGTGGRFQRVEERDIHISFSPLSLPLQPTFRGNIKCSYNKKNMKIESDRGQKPAPIISLSFSVHLPRDPTSFSQFSLLYSLYYTPPLLSSLRCPPINTPLPPDRVTDHSSVLYIPRRQQLLYILHPVLLPQLTSSKLKRQENLNRCTDDMINARRVGLFDLGSVMPQTAQFFCLQFFWIDCSLEMQENEPNERKHKTFCTREKNILTIKITLTINKRIFPCSKEFPFIT